MSLILILILILIVILIVILIMILIVILILIMILIVILIVVVLSCHNRDCDWTKFWLIVIMRSIVNETVSVTMTMTVTGIVTVTVTVTVFCDYNCYWYCNQAFNKRTKPPTVKSVKTTFRRVFKVNPPLHDFFVYLAEITCYQLATLCNRGLICVKFSSSISWELL